MTMAYYRESSTARPVRQSYPNIRIPAPLPQSLSHEESVRRRDSANAALTKRPQLNNEHSTSSSTYTSSQYGSDYRRRAESLPVNNYQSQSRQHRHHHRQQQQQAYQQQYEQYARSLSTVMTDRRPVLSPQNSSYSTSTSQSTSASSSQSPGPAAARDSILEPDTYATFTSSNINTATQTPPNPCLLYQKPDCAPPLRITKYAVHSFPINNNNNSTSFRRRKSSSNTTTSATSTALLTITRNAVHLPSPFSSHPLLTLLHSSTHKAMGSIRFHHTSSSIDIDLSNVGRTRLSHEGRFGRKRYKAARIVGNEGGNWVWCRAAAAAAAAAAPASTCASSANDAASGKKKRRDSITDTAATCGDLGGPEPGAREEVSWRLCENNRKGPVVACLRPPPPPSFSSPLSPLSATAMEASEEAILTFERPGLSSLQIDEIVVAAVAVVEALRRKAPSHRDGANEWGAAAAAHQHQFQHQQQQQLMRRRRSSQVPPVAIIGGGSGSEDGREQSPRRIGSPPRRISTG